MAKSRKHLKRRQRKQTATKPKNRKRAFKQNRPSHSPKWRTILAIAKDCYFGHDTITEDLITFWEFIHPLLIDLLMWALYGLFKLLLMYLGT
jgi:hypothetical protein